MEYSLNDLPKAIYYILTLHPNEKISPDKMLNYLCDENTCPDLTNRPMTRNISSDVLDKILLGMFEAQRQYKNVIVDKCNMCMLQQQNAVIKNMKQLMKDDRLSFLHGYDHLHSFLDDQSGDNENTILHLLVKNKEIDLLKYLEQYSKNTKVSRDKCYLDFTVKNKNNESVIDILDEDPVFLKQLLKIVVEQSNYSRNRYLDCRDENNKLGKALFDWMMSSSRQSRESTQIICVLLSAVLIMAIFVFNNLYTLYK